MIVAMFLMNGISLVCYQECLGSADLCEEIQTGSSKIVTVTGVKHPGKTVSILLRGSNRQVGKGKFFPA